MNISLTQLTEFQGSIKKGLQTLAKPAPQTPVEYANENFYLSSESSYQEGRWETLPFQVAILNIMGNDEVRTLNLQKSARVGYTQMLKATMSYQVEHKRRHLLIFLPTDGAAEGFMKSQIEPTIRDVAPLKALAPWYGIKHRNNTLEYKLFTNNKQIWCLGGASAKNYREKSVDTVVYDELDGFEPDVEKEGSPTSLGDKRNEGSTFPKSIRGSTPKIRGTSQIESSVEESPHYFRFHVPCPCCGKEQYLKWGGKDCDYGIKWDPEAPLDAWYVCEHTGCVVRHHEMQAAQDRGRWICELTGIWTRDGLDFFDEDDHPNPTPESVSMHIWAAYSPLTTWGRMVLDFLKSYKDPIKLKTFVNTTLGETWEEEQGEQLDWEILYGRREVYQEVPAPGLVLMGSIDTQDDRYEGRVWAFGAGEESWLVDKWVLMGDPASVELRRKVGMRIHQLYTRVDAHKMRVERWCWDSGGHYTDEVYEECRRHGDTWVIPVKGANKSGKPIANWPKARNAKKVYLVEVGTENAKELFYSRLKIQPSQPWKPTPGCVHLPANDDICGEDELKQLTAEKKVLRISRGKRIYVWEAGGRRNEGLDCAVYALAALRISQQRFGLDLELLMGAKRPVAQRGTRSRVR
ncbi:MULTISPECIES: phage terminase large subunit family protein [unclassified Pseudomonas]|uniref:phage terminase large subunit family protein n=1 Tax=unclassified Pseudomonas TaxID=196821 RepID=UPI001C60EE5A|nr:MULTISPECIES: terminase gpA endonuclease subunit [unclassified Pseudomonas]MBW5416120.1 phage terminase large subunit family protein [Pseudomonas sp. MAG002Y]